MPTPIAALTLRAIRDSVVKAVSGSVKPNG
jgi:hypothetical protein